ncbi:MAG TPA: hypothetical protein GYA07_08800 [Verrucomicrobia bacterium]|nr:hypothetical protein [Verrucomicrobiota bacterium]HOB32107.1 hypothetical protein [Verrucomicrobiota bacterium]
MNEASNLRIPHALLLIAIDIHHPRSTLLSTTDAGLYFDCLIRVHAYH